MKKFLLSTLTLFALCFSQVVADNSENKLHQFKQLFIKAYNEKDINKIKELHYSPHNDESTVFIDAMIKYMKLGYTIRGIKLKKTERELNISYEKGYQSGNNIYYSNLKPKYWFLISFLIPERGAVTSRAKIVGFHKDQPYFILINKESLK